MYALLIEGADPEEIDEIDEQLSAPLTEAGRSAERALVSAVQEVFHGHTSG